MGNGQQVVDDEKDVDAARMGLLQPSTLGHYARGIVIKPQEQVTREDFHGLIRQNRCLEAKETLCEASGVKITRRLWRSVDGFDTVTARRVIQQPAQYAAHNPLHSRAEIPLTRHDGDVHEKLPPPAPVRQRGANRRGEHRIGVPVKH